MWEAGGGIEPSVPSGVGLFDVFVPGVPSYIMGVVSITATVSPAGTSIIIRSVHIRCRTSGCVGCEEEVVGGG